MGEGLPRPGVPLPPKPIVSHRINRKYARHTRARTTNIAFCPGDRVFLFMKKTRKTIRKTAQTTAVKIGFASVPAMLDIK